MRILEPFDYKNHKIELNKHDDGFVYSIKGPLINQYFASGYGIYKPKVIVAYFKGLVDNAHKESMIDKFFDKRVNMKLEAREFIDRVERFFGDGADEFIDDIIKEYAKRLNEHV